MWKRAPLTHLSCNSLGSKFQSSFVSGTSNQHLLTESDAVIVSFQKHAALSCTGLCLGVTWPNFQCCSTVKQTWPERTHPRTCLLKPNISQKRSEFILHMSSCVVFLIYQLHKKACFGDVDPRKLICMLLRVIWTQIGSKYLISSMMFNTENISFGKNWYLTNTASEKIYVNSTNVFFWREQPKKVVVRCHWING